MRLSDLLAELQNQPSFGDLRVNHRADGRVGTAVHDSRLVRSGDLFCCVPGEHHDGHDHAAEAVAAGAGALLCERPLDLGVPELIVPSVRRAMGPVAAALAGHPSRSLLTVGVTGTNGKTTTVHLLDSIFRAAGHRSAVVGTLTGVRTTPEAPELQNRLAADLAAGVRTVSMEVSSHAIALHRIDGVDFDAVVFTNLSRDHLDFHGDMASYFRAKARLFEPDHARLGIVNRDDPNGRLLGAAAPIDCLEFGIDDAHDLRLEPDHSTFTWRDVPIRLALTGRFNVSNALAAATTAAAVGVDVEAIATGLRTVGAVPGRLERIDLGQPFLAAVDYAHTPDGLEQLLVTARELAHDGRVVIVFGAGGDRDRSKRPRMGEVAGRLADDLVLTTDNPRTEDPAAIIDEIRRGATGPASVHVEEDRRTAIARAVTLTGPGDVLLVAGKGHETTQTVGDRVEHFDDREELRAALTAHLENQP